jgi:hypothetical protein
MVDQANHTESHSANGLDYLYEFLADGWVAVYEYRNGLPLRPLIQACSREKADEYICLREPVPVGTKRLVSR